MPISTMPELTHAELTFGQATFSQPTFSQPASIPQPAARSARPTYVRRRGSSEQGRALETLGHAVEYLVDSRMRFNDPQAAAGERDAIELLMRLNRAVFAECPEVVPLSRRVRQWFAMRLSRVSTS